LPRKVGVLKMIRCGASVSRISSSSSSSISGGAGAPFSVFSASANSSRWRFGVTGSMPWANSQSRFCVRVLTIR
jgi:hypothetical protein